MVSTRFEFIHSYQDMCYLGYKLPLVPAPLLSWTYSTVAVGGGGGGGGVAFLAFTSLQTKISSIS